MGLPIIGLVVRQVANGVGLASEALQARKQHKERSRSVSKQEKAPELIPTGPQTPLPASGTAPNGSTGSSAQNDQEHVVLPVNEAEQLIANGQAVPVGVQVQGEITKKEDVEDFSDDEEAWALDDAATAVGEGQGEQENAPKQRYGVDAQPTIESMTNVLIAQFPAPPTSMPRLPLPVILPQRRPGDKQRGFVHAYAPMLAGHNIDESSFLSFLTTFHKATQASPVLGVIMVSSTIAGFVPEMAAQITTTVVQVAVGVAIELQRRQRTNSFLDEVNKRLFEPRGLYAMIMSSKPEQKRPIDAETLNMDTLISKRQKSDSHTFTGALKLGAGTTYGDIELPESAPLTFPKLDEAVASGDAEKTAKLKVASNFLGDYYDRRAQAVYVRSDAPTSPSFSTLKSLFKTLNAIIGVMLTYLLILGRSQPEFGAEPPIRPDTKIRL